MTANRVQQGLVNFFPNFTANNDNSEKIENTFETLFKNSQKSAAKIIGVKVEKSSVLSESVTKQESITENLAFSSEKPGVNQFNNGLSNGTVKQTMNVLQGNGKDEDIIENIQEMLMSIFNTLSEKLGISPDELKDTLQNMSEEAVSLLDESGIKAIYMEVRMVTEIEILTNYDLSSEYSSIQDEFKSILEEMKSMLDIILGDEAGSDIRTDFEKVFEKSDFQLIKDYQKEGKDFESVFEKEYFTVELENNKTEISLVQSSNEKGFNSKSESHKDKDANGLHDQEVILNNLASAFVKDISDEAMKIDMASQVREVVRITGL
ncbi:MAG: hypothetical protein MJ113_06170 [Lachnospiraceae bacterium]|nr:hypothetical protein [Lachnospiraceae bacterium]